jgi:DNA-binding response OmpR family regulator
MAKTKILLAEDDENLGLMLKNYLKAKRYKTDLYQDGEKALNGFLSDSYDLCIIDVMMPVKDGFMLAKEVRKKNAKIPIIFLTARSMQADILEGFKIGADDYITKPFNIDELLFRIGAILRRTDVKPNSSHICMLGTITFDTEKQILQKDDLIYRLTTKEFDLLKLLSENVNQVVERNFILKTLWDDESHFAARSMDVYMSKLRKYFKNDSDVEIMNVYGRGYKLAVHR